MDKSLKNIEAINYEAQQFLSAFARFREVNHVVDQTLCTNLLKIVSKIDDFLDSKPKEISISQREQFTPGDLKKVGFHKTFICKPCQVDVGQSLDNVRAHLRSWRHLNPKKDKEGTRNGGSPMKSKLDSKVLPKKAKSLIQGNLKTFFTTNIEIGKKLMILPDYKVIENELLTLIRPAFPGKTVKLYLFGSRISGIGTIYSDLDIFVDIGDVFNTFENRASPETIKKLQTVHDLLKNNPNWLRLVAIQNARVPILKIFHKPTSTNCDIGFSNSLGFCNTKLTKYLLELQPEAKAICLLLKKWLDRTKLNEHITTYSVILLVVSYFQMKMLLPSVKSLQENLEGTLEIGPWLATFAEKSLMELHIPPAGNAIDNFKKELGRFFNFYSKFDFEHNVICPYLGHIIPLSTMETDARLPRYTKYMETEKEKKDAQFKKAHMNVQDPFQLNHNITKAVPAMVVLLLKQYFELSVNLIGEAADLDAGIAQIDMVENPKE